ncbi:MAG: lasso RiPP family leader peptide-containing protein [Gemmatimonadetes bacterium]|nr:lasso RiPP family leader peptide-containing protein [Gemmatimonadota bacterium]
MYVKPELTEFGALRDLTQVGMEEFINPCKYLPNDADETFNPRCNRS